MIDPHYPDPRRPPYNPFPDLWDGVYIPPRHFANNMRRLEDVRETYNFRGNKRPVDWYDRNLSPWIISQYSTDKEPAFDFRTQGDLRSCHDIRHPWATTIGQLVFSMGRRLRTERDFELLIRTTLDLFTAQGVALDDLGKIINIDRVISVEIEPQESFGFSGQYPRGGFGQAAFTPNPRPVDGHFDVEVNDYFYRKLLWFKAIQNRSDDSTGTINNLLRIALGSPLSTPYLIADLQSMHIRLIFLWDATPLERAIVIKAAKIAKPLGVALDYYIAKPAERPFGFKYSDCEPFGRGGRGAFCTRRVIELTYSEGGQKDDGRMWGFKGSGLTNLGSSTVQPEFRYWAGTFNSMTRLPAQGKPNGIPADPPEIKM